MITPDATGWERIAMSAVVLAMLLGAAWVVCCLALWTREEWRR